jgi:hypothetical protein
MSFPPTVIFDWRPCGRENARCELICHIAFGQGNRLPRIVLRSHPRGMPSGSGERTGLRNSFLAE